MPLSDRFDIIVAFCGGYPKDITLYQAQKGLNNEKMYKTNFLVIASFAFVLVSAFNALTADYQAMTIPAATAKPERSLHTIATNKKILPGCPKCWATVNK